MVDALDGLADLLVGASRKRFLGALLAGPDEFPRPPAGRETATAVISALAALHGVWRARTRCAFQRRCAQSSRRLGEPCGRWR